VERSCFSLRMMMMMMMRRRRRRTRKKTKKICWVVAGRMIGIGNHGSLRVVGWLEEEVWCLDSCDEPCWLVSV